MTTPLAVLFVEDSADDQALLLRELRRAGYAPVSERVETPEDFSAALARGDWQIILADYAMPRFSGLEALRLLKQSGRDVPFILISGTVGEEVAVEAMKAGASDYLLKDKLTRLGPAVARELREAEERRQRRQAEAALRESQALLALVYDHTAELLALATANGDGVWRVVSLNRPLAEFARRVGRPLLEADWHGRPLPELLRQVFPLAIIPDVADRLREAVTQGRPVAWEAEVPGSAGAHWTEQAVMPVPGPPGGRPYVLWTGRDVTERKQAEERQRRLEGQLAQAQKLEALGKLAGGIAHDFNNLLSAISGQAELLQMDAADPAAVREGSAQMLKAVHRATDLVRRILTFSRKQAASRQPLDLAPVVREALAMLRPMLPPGVELAPAAVAPGTPVLADGSQVHQVILNLCTNALQAMGEAGGRLTVALEPVSLDAEQVRALPPLRPGPHVRLTVSDTGPGMDAATVAKIFEPFFTTKPVGVGTGLGLSVVHGIVQGHDAAVTVQSRPGQGATFQVYFPAAPGWVESAPAAAGRWTPGRGEAVLLVDDDAAVAQTGAGLLRRLGYEPAVFTDPRQAAEAFRQEPQRFVAVITDLTMPHLNGLDLARQLHAIRPEVPVVLTSGFAGALDERTAQGLGLRALLAKPFQLQQLAEVLTRVRERDAG